MSLGQGQETVADHFRGLDRNSAWRLVERIPVTFPTFHPQGMVKVGDTFFASSVEIVTPTERYDAPQEGYDRTPGEGVGHLFKFDSGGNLLDKVTLGEGAMYHPGGIDFDIDYQDCHAQGNDLMLCGGLVNYARDENLTFALGGLELVELTSGRPVYQLPVTQWTESGLVMTQNPFFAEARPEGLRLFFMPEDDSSTLYVYDVTSAP